MKFLYRSFLLVIAACFILGTAVTAGAVVPTDQAIEVNCADVIDNASIKDILEVDFYAITLDAGESLSIDINTDPLKSQLDSVLGVFDTDGITILAFNDVGEPANSDDQKQVDPAAATVTPSDTIPMGDVVTADPPPGDLPNNGNDDSYLLFVAPADGTYYVAVASYGDEDFDGMIDDDYTMDDLTTGPYTIIFQCIDPPESLSGGELLGSTIGYTPEETGLFMINPENGIATLRFPFGSPEKLYVPVLEIEFRDNGVLFGATGDGSSNIITIDPDTGIKTVVGIHQAGEVNALEFVGDTLYGAFVEDGDIDSRLVIVDQSNGALTFVGEGQDLIPTIYPGFGRVEGLAFHKETNVMYGATAGGALITINLLTGEGQLAAKIESPDIPPTDGITALEFSLDVKTLYGATDRGDLIKIDPATGAATVVEGIAELSAAAAEPINLPAVTGLSFVPQKESAKEVTFASELGNNVMVKRAFDKFKFKKKLPDIDIFKFEGMPGEYITVTMDGPPNVEGEVSLVVQDVMRDVHLREKVKGLLPLEISLTLPELAGKYLIIVRNLMHNPYKGCYKLTVKSGDEDGLYTGTAHETLEQTWSVEPSGCTDGAAMVPVKTAMEDLSDPPANDGPAGLTSVGESDRAAFSEDSNLEVSIQVSTEQPSGEGTEASDTGDNGDSAAGNGSGQTLGDDQATVGGTESTSDVGATGQTEDDNSDMAAGDDDTQNSGDAGDDNDQTSSGTDNVVEPVTDNADQGAGDDTEELPPGA